jgi:hypothetical protein
MAMLLTLGMLRSLLLKEMKLGVASAYAPGEAWGVKDEPEPFEPEEGGPTYIATMPEPDYDPGEAIKALYRKRGGIDMAGDPIDDELEDRLAADAEQVAALGTRDTLPASSSKVPQKRAG